MENQFLIILIFVLGLALVALEMLIPGMIVGTIGVICMAMGIYFAFSTNLMLGWILAGIAVVSIPFYVLLWVKVLNRVFALKHTEIGYSGAQTKHKHLLGQEGIALTQLRPAGTAKFGDAKVDVMAESEVIERDSRVTVVEVKSNRVIVRAVKG